MDNSPKMPLRLKLLLGLLAVTVMGAATYTVLPGPVVTDTIADALLIDRRVFTSGGRGYVLVERFASNRTPWVEPRKLHFEAGSTLPTNGVYSNLVFAVNGGRLVFRDAFSANEFYPEWWGGEQSPTLIGYTNRLTWQNIAVDSRSAIQAAIDWAAFRGGGLVKLGPGEWRSGDTNQWTIYPKPLVSLDGSGIPMSDDSYEGVFSSTNQQRQSHSTMIHFSGGVSDDGTGNGTGAPCFSFLGAVYYTNRYFQAFPDAVGDWVGYYRGGNSLRNFGIMPTWKWGWSGQNPPSAAIFVDQVAGITFENLFVGPSAGPGVYLRGAFGTRFYDSYIANSLAGGIVVVDSSDTKYFRTSVPVSSGSAISFTGELRTNGTYAATANTHEINGVAIWNGKEELTGWNGTSQTVTNWTTLENSGVRRSGWSADASTDLIGVPTRIGSDTGLPVMFRGTGLPGGVNTNSIYYVRWGAKASTNFYICLTSGRALNGGPVVDITSSGGTNWWLESPSAAIYASDSQEIHIQGARMDQSWGTLVHLRRTPRFIINGVNGFEVGLNQTEVRQSRKQTWFDPNIVAIRLEDCNDGVISGNLISGSKGNSSLSSPWIHSAIGVQLTRTFNTTISGNTFARLNTAILIDGESADIETDGNSFKNWVSRQVDSASTYGIAPHTPYFDGRTNSQIVAPIAAAYTNVSGDFAIAFKARVPSMTTNGFANGRHSPLANLSSVTNTTGDGALVFNSAQFSFWRSSLDNSMNIVGTLGGSNFVPSNLSTEAFRFGAGVTPFMGKDVEVVIQRQTNWMQIYVEGIRVANQAITTISGTGSIYAPYFLIGQVADSGQYSHPQAPIYAVAYHVGKSFTTDEINQGMPWGRKGSTNAALLWDFSGASASTGVLDLSGNGSHGVVQQIGAVAPDFGTSDDLTFTAGSGMTVTRTGRKAWTFSSTGGGGVGTITNITAANTNVTISNGGGPVVTVGVVQTNLYKSVLNSGVPNGTGSSVDWSQLKNVPPGLTNGIGGTSIPTNGASPGWFAQLQPDLSIKLTNVFSALTISGDLTIGGNLIPTNPIAIPYLAPEVLTEDEAVALYQPLDPQDDLTAIGGLSGTGLVRRLGPGSFSTVAFPGDTNGYLRADGTFATPPGTGGTNNFISSVSSDLQVSAGALSITNTQGSGALLRASAALIWDVDTRFSITNTASAMETVFTEAVPDGQTRMFDLDLVMAGATNGYGAKLFGRLSNRGGSTMLSNNVVVGGSTDANTVAFITNSGTNLIVLARGPSYQPFNGHLRGMRQIVTNAGAYSSTPTLDTNGLRLVWRFDEATNGTRTSDDAYALKLTATNTVNYISSGVRSNAARFSRASSQSLGMATTNLVEVTNENFSVTAWVNPSSFLTAGQLAGIATKVDPGVNARVEWGLYSRYNGASAIQFEFTTGTNGAGSGTHTIVSSTLATTTNTWYMVAGGRDSTLGSNWISVNGSAKEWIGSPTPGPTITPFRIGLFGSATHFWNGLIDEVTFWRTNLTMTQIGFLTNNPPPTLP